MEPTTAETPASPSSPAPAKGVLGFPMILSGILTLAAIVMNNLPLSGASTDSQRLVVRLASAAALLAVLVAAAGLLRASRPRRMPAVWLVMTLGVFVYSMFEYGARGR